MLIKLVGLSKYTRSKLLLTMSVKYNKNIEVIVDIPFTLFPLAAVSMVNMLASFSSGMLLVYRFSYGCMFHGKISGFF